MRGFCGIKTCIMGTVKIKIIKKIKLSGFGYFAKGDVVENYPKSGAEILIRKGFAEEVKRGRKKSDKE